MAAGTGPAEFSDLAGLEQAIFAVALGLKALRATPEPALERRRGWAGLGIGLGVSHITLVAAVILLNLDRLPRLFEALRAFSDLR